MAGRRKRREADPIYDLFDHWNGIGEMIINGIAFNLSIYNFYLNL